MRSFPPLPHGNSTVLPPVGQAALLLDLDGTLLDIAPTPDSVVVEAGMPDVLRRLRAGLNDALAIVTGRPVAQVDALFQDTAYAVAGEHGAAIRHHPGEALRRAELPAMPSDWVSRAARLAEKHQGVLLEHKLNGFVVHYRLAPSAGDCLGAALEDLVAARSGDFEVLPALMAWEVRARGVDKGTAVAALMREAPFAGRLPIFIGDDRTDLDGMRVCVAMGGSGLFVPEVFADAAGVRAWLADAAGLGGT